MRNLKEVQALTKSPIPEIANAAIRALELYELVNLNQLTKSEFEELLDDVVRLDNINQEMIAIETLRLIAAAYDTILTLKNLASI